MKIVGNALLVAGALGLLGLVVAGCAGSHTGNGGDGAAGAGTAGTTGVACTTLPVPFEQFQEQLADVLCDGVAPCCSAANVPYSSTCKSTAREEALQLLPSIDSPNLAYDPAGAARCLCALKQKLASCQNFDDDVEQACQGIAVGTLPTGSACTRSWECAPPGYCKLDPSTREGGSCSNDGGSNYPRAKAGESCVGSCRTEQDWCEVIGPTAVGNYCYRADGLYCASATQVCTKFGRVGEPCARFESPCASGEYCSSAGKCAAQTDSGSCADGGAEACTSDSYCSGGRCQGPRKADGEPCFQSVECAGKICVGSDAENAGHCIPEVAASGHRCEGALK